MCIRDSLHTGQYASAFHYFSAAINLQKVPNLHPTKDEAKAYVYLALSLAKLDDFENSCAAYSKAIEMNKNDPLAYLNFAITLHKYEDRDKALEMLQAYKHSVKQVKEEEGVEAIDQNVVEMAEKLQALLEIWSESFKTKIFVTRLV